MTDTTMGSTEV